MAKAYRMGEPILLVERRLIEDRDEEVSRFQEILEKSKAELTIIREKAKQEIGRDQAAIFDAHLLILEDSAFLAPIVKKIQLKV